MMKTMDQTAKAALILAAGIAFQPGLEAAERSNDVDKAFGPPISVPRENPKSTMVKPQNLIDQNPAVVRGKSIGCMDCHRVIEEMHASPNVLLGCTDCHGGNPTPGLKQSQAHVLP